MPSTGVPASMRSAISRSSSSSRDPLDRLRKGADSRQDHAVGFAGDVVVGRDHGLGADSLQSLLDRPQVAHSVVEDRHARRRHVKVPFVLGTPLSSGSIETATRRARAKALNDASIRWWALDPYRVLMCRVSFAFEATARKNSSASSVSKPAIETAGSSDS